MLDLLTIDLAAWLTKLLITMVAVMGLFTLLVMPVMRLSALAMAAMRALVRAVPRLLLPPGAIGDAPARRLRELRLSGLSGPMILLVRATRTLALELRRASTEAAEWPADSVPLALAGRGWRELLMGADEVSAPLTAIRDQVFAWLGQAETLPVADRETLAGLGVDPGAVRRTLTGEGEASQVVRALAGLMWGIDERLAAASTFGYRASGLVQAGAAGTGARPAAIAAGDDDDERVRRGRWAGTVAEHGPGLSQMAASYTRNAAERADLEQDIALALWRALPMFRGESSLKTFAYRVARYCCFRHVRRRREVDVSIDPASVADPAACIESAILRADERARIEQALTDLPDNLETVMTLHLSGHSYAQIAATLGITERNVSVRLSRARARLRRQLVAA
ncbi:sigma-70 family RNA polymerase sigma factor [Nannocystis punicea]|uniref:Sigma-70 family RNA polymerase sigma factor n=1 Tax=Nannocystis punicea TaxID=2995304 RepID=A0ABY7GWB5_9BACT|nr:sigma-70 family RNA polymerase sigma factor [Nannocystis poenicansa]WAS91248.1 sigma-70 family RNA polymerase sigma factor [Nannocystis poenicansa]